MICLIMAVKKIKISELLGDMAISVLRDIQNTQKREVLVALLNQDELIACSNASRFEKLVESARKQGIMDIIEIRNGVLYYEL